MERKEAKAMLKYLAAFMLLLTIGVVGAQVPVCPDCYANVITQKDTQTVEDVRIGISVNGEQKVGIGNEVSPQQSSSHPRSRMQPMAVYSGLLPLQESIRK